MANALGKAAQIENDIGAQFRIALALLSAGRVAGRAFEPRTATQLPRLVDFVLTLLAVACARLSPHRAGRETHQLVTIGQLSSFIGRNASSAGMVACNL
jgi:hypothetical protein